MADPPRTLRPRRDWLARLRMLSGARFRTLEPTPPYAQSRSEEHTSELQSLMRISYAVFCLKKKKNMKNKHTNVYNKNNHTKKNKQTITYLNSYDHNDDYTVTLRIT